MNNQEDLLGEVLKEKKVLGPNLKIFSCENNQKNISNLATKDIRFLLLSLNFDVCDKIVDNIQYLD